MMLALALAALFGVTAIATALSLADSWIRGRSALRVLRREQALLAAGFVPQIEPSETRLRQEVRRSRKARDQRPRSLVDLRRGSTRRVPLPQVDTGTSYAA